MSNIIYCTKCNINPRMIKRTLCYECYKEHENTRRRIKYATDPIYRERVNQEVVRSTEKRIDKVKKYRKEYYSRENIKQKVKLYLKQPEVIKKSNHYKYLHKIDKLKACPKWLSNEQLEELRNFYINCPEGYEVDHIIPLKGKNVRGLHVPWNLQYLKREDNNFKSNKFDGTYQNESWKEEIK